MWSLAFFKLLLQRARMHVQCKKYSKQEEERGECAVLLLTVNYTIWNSLQHVQTKAELIVLLDPSPGEDHQ